MFHGILFLVCLNTLSAMSVDFVCVRACTYTNRKGSSCGLKAVLGFVASKSLAEFGMFTTRCAIAHETVLLSFCEVV